MLRQVQCAELMFGVLKASIYCATKTVRAWLFSHCNKKMRQGYSTEAVAWKNSRLDGPTITVATNFWPELSFLLTKMILAHKFLFPVDRTSLADIYVVTRLVMWRWCPSSFFLSTENEFLPKKIFFVGGQSKLYKISFFILLRDLLRFRWISIAVKG